MKINRKNRKGFSLVELVVVIIIIAVLAVVVFAGGSAVIRRSQVSRTVSDLHNFSVAIEAAMNENPSVANISKNGTVSGTAITPDDKMKVIVDAVNDLLSTDYQLDSAPIGADVSGANLNIDVADGSGSYLVYKSAKTDAWDNPYYVIFDFGERHCKGQSDFYITVVSAGPNAQTTVGGAIEADDIFLLVQYSDGDVAAATYNCSDKGLLTTVVANADATEYTLKKYSDAPAKTLVTKGSDVAAESMLYAGGANNTGYTAGCLPVNF